MNDIDETNIGILLLVVKKVVDADLYKVIYQHVLTSIFEDLTKYYDK